MHETRPKGVSKDCHGNCNRVQYYGLHRFLRQVNSYSHQQHHRAVVETVCVRVCNFCQLKKCLEFLNFNIFEVYLYAILKKTALFLGSAIILVPVE